MAQRAGRALREKWADEARYRKLANDPAHLENARRIEQRSRILRRYNKLLRAAYQRGELTVDEAFAKSCAAEDRVRVRRAG